MNSKTLRVLEFNKIIDKLRQYASSDLGKAIVDKLEPSTDINEIKLNQRETSEAVSMILKKGSLGLGGLRNVGEYIKRVNISGVLNIEELLHIGDFLRVSRRAKDYAKSESKNDSFPVLEPQFNSIETVADLEREIERCIPSPTEVADDASRALREIRRNIKIANDRIKEQLNSIIHSNTYKNMLQEAVITIRNERYCVPIKQEYKNAFAGLIHDQSATGATVFIEPISIVQLNNKIKELHNKEKIEVEKTISNNCQALLRFKSPQKEEIIKLIKACVDEFEIVEDNDELVIMVYANSEYEINNILCLIRDKGYCKESRKLLKIS